MWKYIYLEVGYNPHLKKNKILAFVTRVNLKSIMLSEKWPSQKITHSKIPFIKHSQTGNMIVMETEQHLPGKSDENQGLEEVRGGYKYKEVNNGNTLYLLLWW